MSIRNFWLMSACLVVVVGGAWLLPATQSTDPAKAMPAAVPLSTPSPPRLAGCDLFPADNGLAWYISGAPDERWDNDVLRELRQVRGSDFEAVDVSSLISHPDSGQVRSAQSQIFLPVALKGGDAATATPTLTALPTA